MDSVLFTITIYTIAYAFCILGIIGCILPVLPGPWLAYIGIFMPYFIGKPTPLWQIISGFLLCTIVTVLDYIFPAIGTKKFEASNYASWGCIIGIILGIFEGPIGVIVGPFLGAIIGEMCYGKPFNQALRAGWGAFLGFLVGTVVKVIPCTIFMIYITLSLL